MPAGKATFKSSETFCQMCVVLADTLQRKDTTKKFGVRYPKDYLNFCILLRSYGAQSAKQFALIAGQLPMPSPRHLRQFRGCTSESQSYFREFGTVKRLVTAIKYNGPVCVAGDCTKVRTRLTYSSEFGGHILGSVLPLEECIAETPDDIDNIISKIIKSKTQASQVRAILIKAVPALTRHSPPKPGREECPPNKPTLCWLI
ncbi:hypothetical protein MIND_01144800 [Mycena indigotica]|uniref:Transposase n=1 Tax=Mycena indigotica TaxID=2126181 RepID=A0A8H6VZB7_9AGAR|nr:uncharacterized protein MIND_01144800 [Mycena indigotica]KAF7293649.1 hypothetical protein MIND_01144800 [Mycena indigotica]